MTPDGQVAAERAYTSTRARILSGELAGGALISEVEVSAELGLSRTPVHEAFLRLSAEQLLDLKPRKGAVVRPMTPSEATNVLVMRHAIEAAAAQQIFERGGPDPAIRASIEENLERQVRAVAAKDVAAFVESDDEFHQLVVRASDNPIAVHFYEHLGARQQRLRNLLLRIDPANLEASSADHRQLFRCLVDGDAERYASLLRVHFDRYQGAL